MTQLPGSDQKSNAITWDVTLTEADRYPLMTDRGRAYLRALREHPHAPDFNHQCGDRLDAAAIERIRRWEREVVPQTARWRADEPPAWVRDLAAYCYAQVPFHRRHGALPARFTDIPPCARGDLADDITAFVPDDVALDDLIFYITTGTTGHPVSLPWTPESASRYLPLLRKAARAFGAGLSDGPDRVAIALVCDQVSTFTLAQLSFYLEGAGHVKLNLRADAWRQPGDRVAYLDSLNPEIYTGDPISFETLAGLPLRTRPRALISSSMTLLPGLRARLEQRFGCPVIDLYSTNESGPIAYRAPDDVRAWTLLQPRLYVEILDGAGRPCPPGVRGDVVVSGGFNPLLPLLRYRIGDTASMDFGPLGDQPRLLDLEGRAPVLFAAPDGHLINNIEVTHALASLHLTQWALHQASDGSLSLRYRGGVDETALRGRIEAAFGGPVALTITRVDDLGKTRQYTRD